MERDFSLYVLVTGAVASLPLEECVAELLEAGVDAIQLREKDIADRDFLELARRLRRLIPLERAPFIVNDRADIAALAGADGVHLGQDDLPAAAARRILGAGAVIGRSTHDPGQAAAAVAEGADYLAIGPVFPTATKGYSQGIGVEAAGAISRKLSIPVVAIGGITAENLPELLAAGVRRVAVCSAIIGAADVGAEAARFRRLLDAARA